VTEERAQSKPERGEPRAWRGWAIMFGAMAATFLLGILAASIIERRKEARPQPPPVAIAPWESDSARWAVNYPRQYDRYKLTEDSTTKTKYGGSFPRDYLVETPANAILFAGYGFAKEYRQARGHAHAVTDVKATQRRTEKTPATCWTCKSPDVPRLLVESHLAGLPAPKPDPASLDASKVDPAKFYKMSFKELEGHVAHAIGCLDCHEPSSMRLRITRPALREALAKQDKDPDGMSHQEMRSLVCAQCHVEYYFKPEGNYLTFPWARGTPVEKIEEYYDADAAGFSDWTHAVSKAPMLKMQHPDYEVYRTGIHAYREVSCADCHMPYRTEGGVKYTDHYVRSPLLNIANSCAVCHRWREEELRTRVEAIQDKVAEGRQRAEKAICRAHFDVAAAAQAGAKDDDLAEVRRLVRRAQMRWDFVAANNGMGFHSPQECLRVLSGAIDLAGECRVECARILARHGISEPVQYPDFSTKEKAQALEESFRSGNPPRLIKRT
jgi:nitrite reductase (cytochrome c-552)